MIITDPFICGEPINLSDVCLLFLAGSVWLFVRVPLGLSLIVLSCVAQLLVSCAAVCLVACVCCVAAELGDRS